MSCNVCTGQGCPACELSPMPKITNINIEDIFWREIKNAASNSNWIPPNYTMNKWVMDVCKFLKGD